VIAELKMEMIKTNGELGVGSGEWEGEGIDR